MAEEKASNQRIIPDLLNIEFEYLFKTLGREGKYSLEFKCLFLVLILYIPGLITTSLSGTSFEYVVDGWRRFVSTILVGLVVWFLVRFVKKIEDKIKHVNQIISPPENRIDKLRRWAHRPGASWWYYIQAIPGAAFGFILGIFTLDPSVGWVKGHLLNILYYHAWFMFLGFLVGACLFYIWLGFWTIRTYCEVVVSHEAILPLDPDRTGGLRELGRLALDLDLIVALPSIAFPLHLSGEVKAVEPWIVVAILYALLLIFVFFVSISPAHDDMVRAKTNYLLKIHREYKDMHGKILQKLEPEKLIDPEEYERLSGLYELYDRVEKMAVWPLDFQTTLRFSITSLLPLVTIGITISF